MIGYLDLPSGLSGDMLLGCLVDCGWSIDELRGVVEAMGLPGESWSVDSKSVMKGPLRATLVNVQIGPRHHHRKLSDIKKLIDSTTLPAMVKKRAISVFTRLAEAEAKVHGTSLQEVHFHEVGAVDALIDVVGAISGLAALNINTLYASAVALGEGWVQTDHGQMPLPAPATLELLAAVGAPSRAAPGPGESLTPTGAAILAEFAVFEQPAMRIRRIGTGAGQRDEDWPNVARLWLGEPVDDGPVVQMDTNIDDMNPQLYAAVCDRLFACGAYDVWMTPVQMKKDRPAVVLSVLAAAGQEAELADLILRETTTLGLRVHQVRRHVARRERSTVETRYGSVEIKLKWVDEQLVAAEPEYESCRGLAAQGGVSVRAVFDAAVAAAQEFLAANGQG